MARVKVTHPATGVEVEVDSKSPLVKLWQAEKKAASRTTKSPEKE